MDQSTFEVRLAQWAEIVRAATNRPSGTLLRDWLSDNGISRDQYYYWQRKVRAHAYDSMQKSSDSTAVSAVAFAEISVPANYSQPCNAPIQPASSPAAIINVKGISIELSNSASPELISSILKVAAYA